MWDVGSDKEALGSEQAWAIGQLEPSSSQSFMEWSWFLAHFAPFQYFLADFYCTRV